MATKINSNNFTPPSSPLASSFSRAPLSPLSPLSPLFTNLPSSGAQRKLLFGESPSSVNAAGKRKSPTDNKVSSAMKQSLPFSNEQSALSSSFSSSSFSFSLPKPTKAVFTIAGQRRQLERKKPRKEAPEAPVKRAPRSFLNSGQSELEKQEQIELNSYINPSIISDKSLIPLKTNDPEGQYKTPWKYPADPSKLVLTFKNNQRNSSAKSISEHMKSSMEQYNEVKAIPELTDNCVTIYNAATALDDKYFIVERIPESFTDVLINLKKQGLEPFESMQQLNGSLDDNQTIAINLLEQIKSFYNLSIEHGIDTDLHIGNFRVKNNQLILTDFRESIEEGDLMPNKRKEFHEFQKDLGSIFKPEFLNEYFEKSIEKRKRKESEIESRIEEPVEEDACLGISDLPSSAFN
ncbi:MAG: hypothetical protein K1060chlam4_00378 [Candidatus Anoxychlamydiales bacterium]|nr:hypothetical protein [Candidatus Anoxychlamydiales bacterium]